MALIDLFKKKTPDVPAADADVYGAPSEIPLQSVLAMQSQGLTANQIIQTLQRQGYQSKQIYDALAQAEAKKSIEPLNVPSEQPPVSEVREPPKTEHPQSETLVEQLVEQKWQELQKDITKITEWKDLVASRVDKVEQSITDMKLDLDGLHKAIVARIGEYDKTLMDVGTEIKAMEKVFQHVLPELTGNIQELSRITKTVKGPTAKK